PARPPDAVRPPSVRAAAAGRADAPRTRGRPDPAAGSTGRRRAVDVDAGPALAGGAAAAQCRPRRRTGRHGRTRRAPARRGGLTPPHPTCHPTVIRLPWWFHTARASSAEPENAHALRDRHRD